MAISIGTTISQKGSGVSSLTFSSFNATGYDMLVVGGGDRVAVSSVAFNTSENFTMLTASSHTASEARQGYLRNPTATTASVVVTFASSGFAAAILTPLSGTSSTVSAVATGGSNTNTTSLSTGNITCTVGDLLIAYWAHGNAGTNTFNTPTGGSSATIQLQDSNADQFAVTTGTATANPTNMGLTNSGASVYASSGFAITPAGAGSVQELTLLLTGVGS